MRILYTLIFVLISVASFSQRYAVANGSWSTAIWASTPGGAAGSAAVPISTDDVYTNGHNITVSGTGQTCRNLFVTYNVVGSISLGSLARLNITGTLSGYDDSLPGEEFPTVAVITYGNGSTLNFTGANTVAGGYDPYVIYFWDSNVPIRQAFFNFGAGNTRNLPLSLQFSALARVQSGTLTLDPGVTLSAAPASTVTLDISTGATLTTDDPLGSFNSITSSGTITTSSTITATNVTVGGTITTSNTLTATNLTVNGGGLITSSSGITTTNTTISGTINTSGFLNASGNLILNANALLNTSYTAGTGWYSGVAPAGISLDATSTVNFSANGAQNIPITTYGNLTLSGSGTKTASGVGSLTFQGNINNSSSAVTFSPTQDVLFTGTAATQTISGTGTISFASGVEVDKSSGSVNVNRAITIAGGLAVTSGTLNLGSQTVTLTSGNLTNTGTFTPGTSTFVVNGTTQINGTGVSFNNLTIGASGNFTAPAALTLTGNLTNSGTFNSNSGTLSFTGTTDQTLTGTFTLNNVTCSNSGTNGVLVAGTVNLLGALTLSTGRFDADGSSNTGVFIVRSTDIGSGGRIAALTTPANFTGNVTIERYINAPEDYRYMSMPITNGNVGMWHDDFGVTGNFSNATTPAQNPNVLSASAPSIFSFNGASQSYTAVGSGATTSGTTLSNTVGYVVWPYNSSDITVDVTGTIGKGNINITGLAAGQYNLVPNPYPSAIDWDLITGTGFSSSMYMTTGQGSFATYTRGGGFGVNHPNSDWSGEIALGQSFWVQSTSGTSLSMTESAKIATYDFVRTDEAVDYFKIKLLSGSTQSDELGIAFRDNATIQNDEEFDAPKRLNPAGLINFSSYNDNASVDYAINVLPKIQCNSTIKLKMSEVSAGQYTMRFSNLDKMQLGYVVKLKDNFANQENTVSGEYDYAFNITSDPASSADTRFEIRLESPVVNPLLDLGLSPNYECGKDYVQVEFGATQQGVNYLLKLGDNGLHEPIIGTGSEAMVYVSKSSLAYGANSLSLVASSLDGCNAQLIDNAITLNLSEINEITSQASASRCGPGQLNLSAQGASANGTYRWYESSEATEAIPDALSSSFTTPELTESHTYFVTAVNSNGCESINRVPVQAVITGLEAVTLISNNSNCGPGKVTLSAAGVSETGSYRWYDQLDAPASISSGSSFTTPVISSNTTYYVAAVNALGCESPTRVPVKATISDVPVAAMNVDGYELSTEAIGTIEWLFNGTVIEGETGRELTVKNSGTYAVRITNSVGCSATSEGVEFFVTGVEDSGTIDGFSVYPNPTDGVVQIHGRDLFKSKITVQDASGKKILNVVDVRTNELAHGDLTKSPKGLYIVTIQKDKRVIQLKAIKK